MCYTNSSYPGIPTAPKPTDGHSVPKSGNTVICSIKSFVILSGLTTVCVLHPKYPTSSDPTANFEFFDSMTLNYEITVAM